jgi:hypothetical protein
MTAAPDPEALVVALTLAPATWSRNRFFELYKDASVRRARRRATLVRCVAADLAGKPEVPPGHVLEVRPVGHDLVRVTYEVPAIGLRRATTLDGLEIALLRYVLRRAARAPGAPDARALGEADGGEPDRTRIEAALARMPPNG